MKDDAKKPYTDQEKNILYDAFLEKFLNSERVTGAEISAVINKRGNECLRRRCIADIRFFFQREMKVWKKNKPPSKTSPSHKP